MYGKMNGKGKKTKYYSGEAVNKAPKPFEKYGDPSMGMMNVPDNVLKQAATGYNLKGLDFVTKGTKEGKKLGKSKSYKKKGMYY